MTDQELKKLSRKDLLELLLTLSREREKLQAELERTKQALQDRRLQIDNAGSIAEAAIEVNGVYEAAQAAAQQYLDNIRQLSERQEAVCAQREMESQAEADRLLRESAEKCQAAEAETRRRCEAMTAEAAQRAETYWTEVSRRLQAFTENHQELKRLLELGGRV